jgi:flagellar motor switch protein FliG
MPASEINTLRKAALTLHALTTKDMRKVWERLNESERMALSPLLEELSSLGIPKGRHWIDDDGGSADIEDSQPDPRTAIRAWRASQALAILSTQSVDTVTMVLRIEPWPWQAEVLDTWPAEQRHALRARLEASASDVPPRLTDALLRGMILAPAQERSMQGLNKPTSSPTNRRWYHGVASLFMLT